MPSSAVATARRLAREDTLRMERQSKTLYNGSYEDSLRAHYNSVRYVLPPDGETLDPCEQDPLTAVANPLEHRGDIHVFDGTLKCFDIFDAPAEKWQEYRKAQKDASRAGSIKPPLRTHLKTQAISVVAFIEANHYDKGVVILSGDPEKDEALKAAARQRYIDFDTKKCESIISKYQLRVNNFRANPRNIGQETPLMSPIERKSQEKLDVYRAGMQRPDILRCSARDCGFWSDGSTAQKVMAVHINMQHGGNVADAAGQIVAKLIPDVPAATPTEPVQPVLTEDEFKDRLAAMTDAYNSGDEEEKAIAMEQLPALEAKNPRKKPKEKAA